MRSLRFSADPLRALIWIEAIAFALALAGDVVVASTVRFSLGVPMEPWLKFYVPLAAATGTAVFSIPHAHNRRLWAIAAAILGNCAIALIPSPGISSIVLLAILGARLTFAFGLRGAATAWAAALAALLCNAVAELHGHLKPAEVLFGIYGISVQLALIFGIIGIMWLYAKRAASTAADAERARIASDLHDALGHSLTTLIVQLQNAERIERGAPSACADYVTRAKATATELLADVRETAAMLHGESAMPPAPLASMLAHLHAEFSTAHALETTWRIEVGTEPSGRVAMAIYRVLQEALTNVVRHAQATHVGIFVQTRHREIELRVEDDGKGLSGEDPAGHGLRFMKMRVESIGGTFGVSCNGAGTLVRALLPLEMRA